ncbi:MAG TPA: QsdR family transcriptional regulator [Solirubrobacteraceae bacterium]|nr:QsdR family transcriptional regulator [Solirubrobacteraceae bacterium]
MARTRANEQPPRPEDIEPPVAERLVRPTDPLPTPPSFRRANPQDAMELARATFLHGARVDMGKLAEQLAVSRATVYRWCGSREQLHERILEQRAVEFTAWARAETKAEGGERLVDVFRLVSEATLHAQPVRRFIEREPALALRILISEHGAVHRVITQGLCEVAAEAHKPQEMRSLRKRIDVAVHVTSALQWVTVAIGEEPQADYLVDIVRTQLANPG